MDNVDLFTGEGIEASPEEVAITQSVDPSEFLPWVEKHRPEVISDMVIPPSIRDMVETSIKINSFGNYILYSGKPGTGKTTLARAIPNTLGTDHKFLSAKRPAELFEEIESYASGKIINGKPRFVVIDEADHPHNPADFYRQLQTIIETTSATLRFILTCNEVYRLPEPIVSRCFPISFDYDVNDKELARNMYRRLKHIADIETSKYGGTVDKMTVGEIVQKCYPDMRIMINTMFNNFLTNKCSICGEVIIKKNESNKDLFSKILTGDDLAVRNYVRETFIDFDGFFNTFADDVIMQIPPHARLDFNVITAHYADMAMRQVNPYVVIDGYTSKLIQLLKQVGMIQ